MVDRNYAKAQIDILPDAAIVKVIAFIASLDEYLKGNKPAQYEMLMKEAGQDSAFLARTIRCSEDFEAIDAEVSEEW